METDLNESYYPDVAARFGYKSVAEAIDDWGSPEAFRMFADDFAADAFGVKG